MRIIGKLSIIAAFSLCFQTSVAQKLVDPNTVAAEYREAAVKRRAEQIKQLECAHTADEAKVLPRDRTAHISHVWKRSAENEADRRKTHQREPAGFDVALLDVRPSSTAGMTIPLSRPATGHTSSSVS